MAFKSSLNAGQLKILGKYLRGLNRNCIESANAILAHVNLPEADGPKVRRDLLDTGVFICDKCGVWRDIAYMSMKSTRLCIGCSFDAQKAEQDKADAERMLAEYVARETAAQFGRRTGLPVEVLKSLGGHIAGVKCAYTSEVVYAETVMHGMDTESGLDLSEEAIRADLVSVANVCPCMYCETWKPLIAFTREDYTQCDSCADAEESELRAKVTNL